MKLSIKAVAWVGLVTEAAAFVRCLAEFIHLTLFASTATMLMKSAQPYLLGALASLAYLVASVVVFRKRKFALASVLAALMIVVLVALKLAFL
jgi:hypothetical protein